MQGNLKRRMFADFLFAITIYTFKAWLIIQSTLSEAFAQAQTFDHHSMMEYLVISGLIVALPCAAVGWVCMLTANYCAWNYAYWRLLQKGVLLRFSAADCGGLAGHGKMMLSFIFRSYVFNVFWLVVGFMTINTYLIQVVFGPGIDFDESFPWGVKINKLAVVWGLAFLFLYKTYGQFSQDGSDLLSVAALLEEPRLHSAASSPRKDVGSVGAYLGALRLCEQQLVIMRLERAMLLFLREASIVEVAMAYIASVVIPCECGGAFDHFMVAVRRLPPSELLDFDTIHEAQTPEATEAMRDEMRTIRRELHCLKRLFFFVFKQVIICLDFLLFARREDRSLFLSLTWLVAIVPAVVALAGGTYAVIELPLLFNCTSGCSLV